MQSHKAGAGRDPWSSSGPTFCWEQGLRLKWSRATSQAETEIISTKGDPTTYLGNLSQFLIVLIVKFFQYPDGISPEAAWAHCLLSCQCTPSWRDYLHLLYNHFLGTGRCAVSSLWAFSSLGCVNPFFQTVFMWQVLQYLNHPGGFPPDSLQLELEGPNSWCFSTVIALEVFQEGNAYAFVKPISLVLHSIHCLNLWFVYSLCTS